jgi:acyl carrier protein
MSRTGAEVLEPVKAWIGSKKPEVTVIDVDLDLIENRIIDSLDFMELIFLLEELTGRETDMNTLTIDSFRSLRAIQKKFFEVES